MGLVVGEVEGGMSWGTEKSFGWQLARSAILSFQACGCLSSLVICGEGVLDRAMHSVRDGFRML